MEDKYPELQCESCGSSRVRIEYYVTIRSLVKCLDCLKTFRETNETFEKRLRRQKDGRN